MRMRRIGGYAALGAALLAIGLVWAGEATRAKTSYAPVAVTEDFQTIMHRMAAAKAEVMKRQMALLGFGKAKCALCHVPPYYTDNLMHNLKAERFFKPQVVNGRMASADGPIKTFPLRGIKDSPPCLRDGRLPTLDDTVEFFNLIQQLRLTKEEKAALVAFMRAL